MSGLLRDLEVIRQFFQPALNSTTLTLVSRKSGVRFTYDVKRKKPRPDGTADEVWYVDLLTGTSNVTDYEALAVITKAGGSLRLHHAKRSRISTEAKSWIAFAWTFDRLVVHSSELALQSVSVYHEGKCGRCGGKLTVPLSLERGLGPECWGKV